MISVKQMRVIVVDPFNREVREEDINPRLFVVGPVIGGCLEPGFHISRNSVLYVHTCQAGQPSFLLSENNIFHGCALITGGKDRNGSPRPARVSVEDITREVQFLEPCAEGYRCAT
jgi:hypothetical protein